ncbi:hydroxylamine reductase [Heliorestis acidaminivorans]|uniref:Hydroxylamine reductase n=1 Tax=Heliorestis acidaminivorans TaxID=553427 RepID=A0A6I0F0L1_9FIRM|nr:hydroxylamine reductase [Heliorestis acidaminivorans]KAB2952751.1 hydroxylamine reductase [Heliorestis acidaminivorans]
MFCNQCEQTAKGTGCTVVGVCGKKPDIAALQDLLLYALKGLSIFAQEGRNQGLVDDEVNLFTYQALFTTVTNVNFDATRLQELILQCLALREKLKVQVASKGGQVDFSCPSTTFQGATELAKLVEQGEEVGLLTDKEANADIQSLQATMIYGIKGLAAYADHAYILGKSDDKVAAYIHEALASIGNKSLTLQDWIGLTLKCGEINLLAMQLLDEANTGTYGHPVPTSVPLGHKKGKAILVSGHDLKDLEELLKQTDGKGIYIYTHGEMLPTHGYPDLKKYEHFYGHYGTAWQNQKKEFKEFPGAILMTTNCIQEPQDLYKENIFTSGLVAWPGVAHVDKEDFTPLIEKALTMPGFAEDEEKGQVLTGFARDAILNVADAVVNEVKEGNIKHFFLVGGCDGAKPGRSYYTDFVEKAPQDTVILTLACGKFRFFDSQLGDIGGIPRLLDVGQCNDAYSAIQVAVALSNAFDCEVNDLPLSLVLSWYEQKAVAILLTLLHLGIKNIRIGPSLPAFITPNVLNVLVENFNIKPISTVEEDLDAILN